MNKREVYENSTVEQLKSAEKSIIDNYMHEIMQMIMDNPTVISLVYSSKGFKYSENDLKTIDGMKSIISNLYIELRKFEELAKNPEMWIEKLGSRFKDNVERYGVVLKFIGSIMGVYANASKIEKLIRQKCDKESFAINSNVMNRKIVDALTKIFSEISVEENTGFVIDHCFEMLDCLSVDVDGLDFSKVVEEIKTEKLSSKASENMTVVHFEPNEKEQERLAKIAEVNDLFERFKIDFMRDLEKEISLMNRDMYESLINKFEKFIKNFSMPLASNVSMGMANEACGQMNKLYEMFYEISKNTYTPVVFGK